MNHELELTNGQIRKTIKYRKPIVIDKIQSKYNEFVTEIYDSLGSGCSVIQNIMLDYQYIGMMPSLDDNRIEINNTDKNIVRRMVHNYWFNKKLPTIEVVLNDVNNQPNFKMMPTSLKALFNHMHYEFLNMDGKSVIMENIHLINMRKKYLSDIQQFRNEGRPIYYVSDTWASPNEYLSDHTYPNTTEDAVLEGVFILNIGSNESFIPDVGIICPESKTNSPDYVANIKEQITYEWLFNVLPLLKDNAVIVVNNSPHYSGSTEIIPTKSWEKKDIIEWMKNKGENMDNYTEMAITDLMVIVDQIKLKCTPLVIDEMAKSSNKTVIRIPNYHYELNPIEFIWSIMKLFLKSISRELGQLNFLQLISIAVNEITQELWETFISNVKYEENMLRKLEESMTDVLRIEFKLDASD